MVAGDQSSLVRAKSISAEFFVTRQQTGAFIPHEITAVGNCHIDTAWLWPYGETKRKVLCMLILFRLQDHGQLNAGLLNKTRDIHLLHHKCSSLSGWSNFIRHYLTKLPRWLRRVVLYPSVGLGNRTKLIKG